MKAELIEFPIRVDAGRFNEDDVIDLTERLNLRTSGSGFNNAELDFIEAWKGDTSDDTGTFYNTRITAAYGIKIEPGNEPGQYTWPKLAAMLRRQR